MPKNRAGFCPS